MSYTAPAGPGVTPDSFGVVTLGSSPTAAQRATNTASLQAAIDAGSSRGVPVRLPSGTVITDGLYGRSNTILIGVPGGWNNPGTRLGVVGTKAALTFDTTAGPFYGGRYTDIAFIGHQGPALEKIGLEQAPTYVYFTDCTFTAYQSSGIRGVGAISEWFFERGTMFGGVGAGFEWFMDHSAGHLGTVDSMHFKDIRLGGSPNALRIRASQGNNIQFDHSFSNAIQQHCWVFEGTMNVQIRNSYASEQMCNGPLPGGGSASYTTGTMAAGSDICTVADASSMRVGNDFCIQGAGEFGRYLLTKITEISGNVVTVQDVATYAVNAQWCTNASYDVLHCGPDGNGIQNVSIDINGSQFLQGSGGGVRFGAYGGMKTALDSVVSPVYDKWETARYIRSPVQWRNPNLKAVSAGSSDGSAGWLQQLSGPGQDAVTVLEPGGGNYTAPWGEWAVHKWAASGGGRVAGINSNGDLDLKGSAKVGTVTSLPTPSATHRGRMLRVEGGTGVADALYVCQKDAAGTYSWAQIA